jgi:hypothetical protein
MPRITKLTLLYVRREKFGIIGTLGKKLHLNVLSNFKNNIYSI